MREALAIVLGVRIVVTKARRLFILEDVRIHLDRVEGLGNFIEFEGVVGPDDSDGSARFEALLTELRSAFGIREDDLLAGSYADLALSHART